MSDSEDLLQFSVSDGWVLREQLLLVFFEVVERALVVFGHPVLVAEHIATLAGDLNQAHFLAAFPALVSVRLQ